MTPTELRAAARQSANLARVTRYYSLALFITDRTGLAAAAARVASELADAYCVCAIQLDRAACQQAREAA
jgi:hypothetical protein